MTGGTPSPRRILFVELLGGFGDLLIALPAIQALARSHPDARLDVLTFAPGADLLRGDPHVAEVHVAPKGGARAAVERRLASERYDLVVTTTAHDGIDALIAQCAPRAAVDLWRDPPPDERVEDRFVRLLIADGLIRPEAVAAPVIAMAPRELTRGAALRPARDAPWIALAIDAGMAIKRWPLERFAALGRALHERHGARVLVVGGGDADGARAVVDGIGPAARVLAPGPLRRLAAILAATDLVIGADTGPCRLGATMGVPTVMLFGPAWAGRYGLGRPHASLQARPDCPERRPEDFTRQACWYAGRCPLPGPPTCVADHDVAEIAAEASRLLAARPARSGEALRHARRVLVVRLDNIGDVLMTQPALRALRAAMPRARLTLLASEAGAQAAPLLPEIDAVIAARTLWQEIGDPVAAGLDAAHEARLIDRLAAGRFDAAIVLTSLKQSPHPAAMACRLAGIPVVAGASDLRGAALTHRIPKGPADQHQVDRNLALLAALGVTPRGRSPSLHVPANARAEAEALLARRGFGPAEGFVLAAPWASAAARVYDPTRMAGALRLVARRTGLRVVVAGAPGDAARTAALARAAGPRCASVAGATDVPMLAALARQAALVVTVNTSAMHIAEALHRPIVALFAGTELVRQWAPRHAPHRVLRRPTACTPCYAFDCPRDHACLDVPPADVAAAACALLDDAAGASRAS